MQATHPQAGRALLLATLAFAGCFSVWTLYAVMGLDIQQQLALSATEYGILLAAPIFSGALLRIPLGILADRYPARNLWLLLMLSCIPALALLPWVESYTGYLLLGLWFGLSGVSFTFGIRYVTDWFASRQQGLAMGLFGVGNAGEARSIFLDCLQRRVYGIEGEVEKKRLLRFTLALDEGGSFFAKCISQVTLLVQRFTIAQDGSIILALSTRLEDVLMPAANKAKELIEAPIHRRESFGRA